MIELNFKPSGSFETNNAKMDKAIFDKFQQVDQTLDQCEGQVGLWNPGLKFTTIYTRLDDMCDKVDDLDTRTMDNIGNRAKELNKELDDITRRLQTM